ncbi:MAG: hypothetical protein WCF44_03090 [Candidatus Methylophosphatis roskildensis]
MLSVTGLVVGAKKRTARMASPNCRALAHADAVVLTGTGDGAVV